MAVERVDLPVIRGATRVLHEDVGQSVNGMTEFSGSALFVPAGFVQLLQEAPVSVPVYNRACERLSRWIRQHNETNRISVRADDVAERALAVTAEKSDFLEQDVVWRQ